MQDIPKNALVGGTNSTKVANGTTAATGATSGYVYDYGATGNGSGKVWGMDGNGAFVVP
jgi:hypothetical protein